MVIKIELGTSQRWTCPDTLSATNLNDIRTHHEDDHVFHSQVLLDELHPGGLEMILVRIIIVTIQTVHNVTLEMIEQVHLFSELFGGIFCIVVLTNIHGSMSPWSDVVKVTVTLLEAAPSVAYAGYVRFVRRYDNACAVIVANANGTVRQSVSHPVFVTKVDP